MAVAVRSMAQHQYDVWYFGDGYGLDFHTTPPTPILSGGFSHTFEGVAVYCDPTTGSVLFTCDGNAIYNRNGQVMPHGTGILGGDSTSAQAATIVPWPCNPGKYFVITTDLYGYRRDSYGSHYSIVDMSAIGGFGDVIAKNIPLNDKTDEHCTVVHYGLGPDYWAILHNGADSTFYAYHISADGISINPVISTCGHHSEVGYLKSSPNGRKLIMTDFSFLSVDLFDFDPFTGRISNPIDLYDSIRKRKFPLQRPYGACFSPDNSKVYFSVETDLAPEYSRIYQCDLSAGSPGAIVASLFCISDTVTTETADKIHYAMEIGPDDKIYVVTTGRGISEIGSPNLYGASCNFQDSKYNYNVGNTSFLDAGLPNNIEGRARIPGVDTSLKYLISVDTLFRKDTVQLCSSDVRYLTINTFSCDSIAIFSDLLLGSASGDYTINRDLSKNKIAGEYQFSISFAPTAKGLRAATYRVVLGVTDTITVALAGYGGDSIYIASIAPDTLRFGDSIELCSTKKASVILSTSGCIIPPILSQFISGPDSSDFTITTKAPTPLTGSDKIDVTFTPSHLGAATASYNLIFSDGKTIVIPLKATVINAPVKYTVTPKQPFGTDSLSVCDSVDLIIHIAKTSCSIKNVSSQAITGTYASDYRIISFINDSLIDNNTVKIRFHPQGLGDRTAAYLITFSDGSTLSIPLSGIGTKGDATFSFSNISMFNSDTLSLCDTLTDTIYVSKRGCAALNILSQGLSDSSDYTIRQSPQDSLTGYDTIIIAFHPTGIGNKPGDYTISFDNGRKVIVALEGIGANGISTVQSSATSLFTTDSVSLCDSLEEEVHITKRGCGVLRLVSAQLTGSASADYSLLSTIADTVYSDNIIQIRFTPAQFGDAPALYTLAFDNGDTIRISLDGKGKNGPSHITLSDQSLFSGDSLSLCDSIVSVIHITKSGCGIVRLVSQTLQGSSASEYTIVSTINDTIAGGETVSITFHPSIIGIHSASYLLKFDNGEQFVVSLAGEGIPARPLSLSTTPSFSVDVLGQELAIPITIEGLDRPQPLEFYVHFDRNLVYKGTRALDGTVLDVPGSLTASSSKVLLPASLSQLSGVSAISTVAVFVDTPMQSIVSFDSLQIAASVSTCSYVAQSSASTTISSLEGCGIIQLSDFLRYNKRPHFKIIPNPATSRIVVSIDLPFATVINLRLMDAIGKEVVPRISKETTAGSHQLTLDLNDLPSGQYVLLATAGGSVQSIPIVIVK